jgi:hypothetical protein
MPSGENPFENAYYSIKVMEKAVRGDFHGFPQAVEHMSGDWIINEIIGKDGKPATEIKMRGSYHGKNAWYDGYFRYIIDVNGEITHRMFEPDR